MSTTLNSSAESASILNSSNDNPSVLNSSAATVNGHSSPDLSGVNVKKSRTLCQGFGSAFFFADPDQDPGKNLHADPDPDPGGIRERGLGVKGKNDFFFEFFSRFR